ncbi:MAG: hypothetical protein RL404_63 [Pseudomonadota bacterium]|jgi:deoxyribodipyrimidine photo-lyase
MPELFAPTDAALAQRIAAIDIPAYGKTRNHLDGRATRLSPYLTHGFTDIPALFERLPRLTLQDKLAFEFGWREFFHHVWSHHGDAILTDMRPALPGVAYSPTLPDDIREGRTGLKVIDRAVHALYQTGHLHNHARMWIASYVIHQRKVHWRTGADWMYAHLLDGDLASNHLSWQWVAATFSAKPYLFNAENVARYAPASWHVDGTALDTSYEALEAIARSNACLPTTPALLGLDAPVLLDEPPALPPTADAADLAGTADARRNVLHAALQGATRIRLVHPWMLANEAFDGLRLGVIHLPFHRAFPWSGLRWRFVMDRMTEVTDALYIGDLADLTTMLPADATVESTATLHPAYREALASLCGSLREPARRFPNPPRACRSFSAFWSQCTGPEGTSRGSWHR